MGITPELVERDEDFRQAVWERATHCGYFSGDNRTTKFLIPILEAAISWVDIAFRYLDNQEVKIYLALTTTMLVYVDDISVVDPSVRKDFIRIWTSTYQQRPRPYRRSSSSAKIRTGRPSTH